MKPRDYFEPPMISARDFLDVVIAGDCIRMAGLGWSIDMSDETALDLSRKLEDAAQKVLLSRIEPEPYDAFELPLDSHR